MAGRLRLAVLLSGSGRTLENFISLMRAGDLDIEIPVVISSRSDARGVKIALAAGIETHVITRRDAPDPATLSARVREAIAPHGVDLIALAGYLRQLEVFEEWRGKMLNIHPALLPLFGGKGMYGHHVHQAVLDSGMKVSGCSVHIVTEEYDSGPIVAQRCVPVLPGDTADTLGARVFEAERLLYPEAIRLFAEGRARLAGERVEIVEA
jgi:formyltetrahydrofolate-dependent phosphoribosylglycinamide formyltransferase